MDLSKSTKKNEDSTVVIKHKYNITYASDYKDTRPVWIKLKESLKVASIPVLIASLCCLSPVILFSLGVVSLSVAADMADVFYGKYKWLFRLLGILGLLIAFYFYMKRSGVCTLDDVSRRRNEILNKFALVIIVGVMFYIFFLYVVVHYIGVWEGLWGY